MDHYLDFVMITSQIIALFLIFSVTNPECRVPLMLSYPLIVSLFIIAFLSLDEKGLDITSCVMDNVCITPMEVQLIMIMLLVYMIYKKGRTNCMIIWVINLFLLITNIRQINQKQNDMYNDDKNSIQLMK